MTLERIATGGYEERTQAARLGQPALEVRRLGYCEDLDGGVSNYSGAKMVGCGVPKNRYPLIRWAAFVGIALLVVRKLARVMFPGVLPSNAWRPELWGTGLALDLAFEIVVLVFLVGVPISIYYFRWRRRDITGRELLMDCGAAATLWMMALLLL